MNQQAEAFAKHVHAEQIPTAIVMPDRDRNYRRRSFDGVLKDAGIQVRKTTYRSPNLQAYVERFIQSIQQECLDHFLLCGEQHVDYMVREDVDYYHHERSHQARGNLPPMGERQESNGVPPQAANIVCRQRLGGLLRNYQRVAA